MNETLLQRLEAILMVIDEPASAQDLAQTLEIDEATIDAALHTLAAEYRGLDGTRARGFELRFTGAGWRIYSSSAFDQDVSAFLLAGKTARLSQAALETLAVIAYRQPVTRAQIAAVRGVNVDGVVRTLVARDLITESGNDPISGAIAYKTTRYFMERMGIESLAELPLLAPALPPIEALPEIDELVNQRTARAYGASSAATETPNASQESHALGAMQEKEM